MRWYEPGIRIGSADARHARLRSAANTGGSRNPLRLRRLGRAISRRQIHADAELRSRLEELYRITRGIVDQHLLATGAFDRFAPKDCAKRC